MTTDLVVIKLDAARQALIEAKTIQETKKVLDVAHAAEIYAKRQQLGEEAIRYATEIKVEALAQLGRMLRETPRARPAVGSQVIGTERVPMKDTERATLSDLGLDKKTSKLAQDIASLPDDQFEKVKSGVFTLAQAAQEARHQRLAEDRNRLATQGSTIEDTEQWQVWQADIETWQAPCQYDFIITDPPYPREYLHLYEVLARRAAEWLKPEGLLIAMCGQSYLAAIHLALGTHLNYYWTACYLTPGQPTPLRHRQVNTSWKPLLIYSRQEYKGKIFGDVFTSNKPDKDHHEWGQSVSGMYHIISQMCLPGQNILDPFCGAGTTGVAALQHGCLFAGIDISQENVDITRARLGKGHD